MEKDLNNLKDIIKQDLERAINLRGKIGHQFRIMSPQGELRLCINSDDGEANRQALKGVSTLMNIMKARAYTLALNTYSPEGIICIGVRTRHSDEKKDYFAEPNEHYSNVFDKQNACSYKTYAFYQQKNEDDNSYYDAIELTREQVKHISNEFKPYKSMQILLCDDRRKEFIQTYGNNGTFPLTPVSIKDIDLEDDYMEHFFHLQVSDALNMIEQSRGISDNSLEDLISLKE